MKSRRVPMRMCLGCNEMKPKKELIRVVKSKEGDISLDLTERRPKRSLYMQKHRVLQKSEECSQV